MHRRFVRKPWVAATLATIAVVLAPGGGLAAERSSAQTVAPAPPDLAAEIAEIPGLETFSGLLDRCGLAARMQSTDFVFAVFAFRDAPWKKLAAKGAEWRDGRQKLLTDEVALGELMGAHVVLFSPDQFGDGAQRIDADTLSRSMLESGIVRTLHESTMPVLEEGAGAEVVETHPLADGHIVVFVIDRVLLPRPMYENFFPEGGYDQAPIADSVTFGPPKSES